MQFRIIIIIIFIHLYTNCLAQDKQTIRVNIKDYNDTSLLLTSYYGDKIRLVDTAYSSNGEFEFTNNEKLGGGIYMAVSEGKSKLFEFIINGESSITFSTDTLSYVQNMKVRGSKENKVFLNYVIFNEHIYKQSKSLNDELKQLEKDSEEYLININKLDSLNKLSSNYKIDIINAKDDLFVSNLLNSMQDVYIPDSIKSQKDSTYIYNYYKDHYWDNLNLSDDRFLRTPMLDKKIKEYFDRLVVFHPDSIIKGIDIVLEKSKSSEEVFSFLIWKFISDYQNPKYMGFDKIFVHLVEYYFQNPEYKIENATESISTTLIERAVKIKPLILGNTAPDLILIDSSGQFISFNHLKNEYIVLLFWDYDCGICKKEVLFIKENLANWNHDIGVYAINVNGDLEKWKDYVRDNNLNWMNVNGTRSVTEDFHDLYDIYGTPVIYLLDKDRNIIAKRMSADQIVEIIDRLD